MLLSILVPVYNEQKTILRCLSRVFRAKLPHGVKLQVVVVDDASTDSTPHILNRARKRYSFICLTHSQNQGKGAAILTALQHARGQFVLIQDADLEYHPRDYQRLLAAAFHPPPVPVVYGSRLLTLPFRLWGQDPTPLPLHYLANRFLSLLTGLLFGKQVSDMETGYKLIDRKILLSLKLSASRFDFEPEVTAKLLLRGIPFREIPIQVRTRSYSQGKKIKLSDAIIAVWTLIRCRLNLM